jgi:hypothetical protein
MFCVTDPKTIPSRRFDATMSNAAPPGVVRRADRGRGRRLLEGAALQTYDVKKERKDLYAPQRGHFQIVDVPQMGFLMVDGHGDPNTSAAYREAVEALYVASYAVRAVGKALGRLTTVAPLEGLRTAKDLEVFRSRDKGAWQWTMMIAPTRLGQPGDVPRRAGRRARA